MIKRLAHRLVLAGPSLRGSRSAATVAGRTPLPAAVNSLALITAKVAAMGLGFLFWLLAARMAPPAVVGVAAAAVSAMMLCTQVAILGFGSAVITHTRGNRERLAVLLNSALVLTVSAGTALSVAFVLLAGALFDDLDVVAGSPTFAALFIAASVFGTLGILLDQSATALRRGDQVLIRNVAFGAGTLLALVAASLSIPRLSPGAVFAPWALAGAVATGVGLWQLRRVVPGYRPRLSVDRQLSRSLIGAALPNHALTLVDRVPGLLLPILVTELLSPDANATWYVAWMMAWVVSIVPVQVGLTMFSEIAHDPRSQRRVVRQGVRTSLGFGLPLAAGVALLAEPLLGLLGPHYAATGTTPLRVLVLAWVPLTFVQAYYAAARARRRLREALAVAAVSAIVSVTAAIVAGVDGGLTPMAVAWVGAQVATGLWAGLRLWVTAPPEAREPVDQRAASHGEVAGTDHMGRRVPRGRAVVFLAWALVVLAGGVAWASVRGLGFDGITDLGLVSILPAGYYVALGLLVLSFVLALRGRERPVLLTTQTALAVVLLFAVTLPLEDQPRFNVVYRHAGVVDHLLRGGAIDPDIDAYFNWPGFFILVEHLVELSGFDSALVLAPYAPLFFNLIALPALVVIARTTAASWRTAWAGVWIYYSANWVGQDYLAPQALAFVLYLTLGVVLLTTLAGRLPVHLRHAPQRRWAYLAGLRGAGAGRDVGAGGPPPAPGTAVQAGPRLERAGVVCVFVLVVGAMVATHQLTPFAVLLMIAALVVAGRTTAPHLFLITSVLLAAWLGWMATAYLDGHLATIWEDALSLTGSVSANVGDRVGGSEEHRVIVYIRLLSTGLLWLLAALGAARCVRRDRRVPSLALLAVVPLILVPLQPYGGEVLLRSYLFALPFAAVLVAAALFPARDDAWSWRTSTVLGLVLCVLMGTLVFTRYGNERALLYTAQERAAVEFVYDDADSGDVVAAASPALPWEDRRYSELRFEVLSRLLQPAPASESPTQLADRVAGALAAEAGDADAYLVITRSQRAYDEMLGAPAWGSVQDLEAGARRADRFRVVLEEADAVVFELRDAR